jgi:uncharacterized metal-binding protein
MNTSKERQTLVIPCSGIGKVQGLISREVAYRVADHLAPDSADTVCLALLVSGDDETLERVRNSDCVTVDGCPKLCALKNVELAGGEVSQSVKVLDALKNHKGSEPGTPTCLSEDGWRIVDGIACGICGGEDHV